MVNVKAARSLLFVPANRPERFVKAAGAGADAVIVDLEDGVPVEAKEAARKAIAAGLPQGLGLLRINGIGTPWHEHDVALARALPFEAIILPKAEDGPTASKIAADTQKPVIALIESALGLSNAREIAKADGVLRLAFGSIDFCADLGCMHERGILLPARFELVLASRLAGIATPIDGVTVEVNAAEIAHADAVHACSLGMGGKLCIHPAQIEPVMGAFRPSQEEIDWAHKVLASGDGVATVDGAMVDEPVRIRARAILSRGT